MLAADYILANTDRHLGNFGFLRDSETLEWKGLAPIYDAPYVDLPLERLDGFSGKAKDILEDAAQFDDGRAAKIAAAVEGRIQMFRLNRA